MYFSTCVFGIIVISIAGSCCCSWWPLVYSCNREFYFFLLFFSLFFCYCFFLSLHDWRLASVLRANTEWARQRRAREAKFTRWERVSSLILVPVNWVVRVKLTLRRENSSGHQGARSPSPFFFFSFHSVLPLGLRLLRKAVLSFQCTRAASLYFSPFSPQDVSFVPVPTRLLNGQLKSNASARLHTSFAPLTRTLLLDSSSSLTLPLPRS